MDIIAINEAIENLENGEATLESVSELSALYTVRNNLRNSSDTVEKELDDILPYYMKYKETKTRYQRNQAIEYEVVQGIKDVCTELKELVDTLYNNTDIHKERMCIKKMIKELSEKYED